MAVTELKAAPGFADHPGYRVDFEPCAKRVRVIAGDQVVADSTVVRLLRETAHTPVYYFPRADVDETLLAPSEKTTYCPFKGVASHWHIDLEGRRIEDAVWGYPAPFVETADIKDYLAFYWRKMDAWYEEDEEVFVHARDPHVRIDILHCERPLKVVLAGEIVAQSTRSLLLFETGLPVRYYLPEADVNMAVLTPSSTRSACPYKGEARYYSAHVAGQSFPDIVWTYPEPLAEVARIKDRLCFFNERVEALILDGQVLPKPVTKWS